MKKTLLSIAVLLSLNNANAQCNQVGFPTDHSLTTNIQTNVSLWTSGFNYITLCNGAKNIDNGEVGGNVFLNTGTSYTVTSQGNGIGSSAVLNVYLKGNANFVIGSACWATINIYKESTATITNNSTLAIVNTSVCSSITSPTAGGCSSSVGIENLTNNSIFSVFPNPVKDVLTIETETDFGNNLVIEIIDVLGKTVLSKKLTAIKKNIDVSALTDGLYFISFIENGKTVKIQKIIK